eukprot:XP_019924265.1 PREDICTED: multiple epidermal growth factor-like domains protein 10 [Crassostrea gigas]
MRTEQIGLNSILKKSLWKVDLGGVYNIYRITILLKNYDGYETRQRGRFAGFSLQVSITENNASPSLCYKDGPKLPPLIFTTSCMYSGRYVTFFNERLEGVNYPWGYELNIFTELCEVVVEGCIKFGVYGSGCDIPCPVNCRNRTCNIQNGECFECNPGWTGAMCLKKCKEGWYGENCTQPCVGHCRANTTCNHVTGMCDGGCDAGWIGYKCDEKCSYGFFGINCSETCNDNCKNNTTCDPLSGVCLNGCEDGYIGTHCNKSCPKGYYGKNCAFFCSPNCETCYTNGLCSCKKGWMGSNCTEGIILSSTVDGSTNILKTRAFWIIGLSISIALNVVFFCTTCKLISLWRRSSRGKGTNAEPFRSASYVETAVATNEDFHYQELNSCIENNYQNLSLH